ncbi:hypothetical protein EDD21DRAFT_62492 [Dissophora ornata]|nr:hypothetical protein BGZ58_000055 [Dissophora ornata]KAI8602777.1 hypothetical protein EDD21DRAFT_62492 [Dissophora ornata]
MSDGTVLVEQHDAMNVVGHTPKGMPPPSKLLPITTATKDTGAKTLGDDDDTDAPHSLSTSVSISVSDSGCVSAPSSASTSPTSPTASSPTTLSRSSVQPLSPILINIGGESDNKSLEAATSTLTSSDNVTPTAVTAVLHKKDSGTSMASTAAAASPASSSDEEASQKDSSHSRRDTKSKRSDINGASAGALGSSRRPSQPDNGAATAAISPSIITPTGRVLTRPLSTSKLSATPTPAPHILPNPQRYAGFNLAALGQLSPSASTSTLMNSTMSRADTLAFLNSNSNTSYFTVGGGTTRSSHHGDIYSLASAAASSSSGGGADETVVHSGTRPTSTMTMCGSDAISLLNLDQEDSRDDLVMIDSNGNSSGNGVIGAAVVGETIASASAIVVNGHSSGVHHHHHGVGGTLAAGLTLTASASSALLGGMGVGNGASGVGGGGGPSDVTAGKSTSSSVSGGGGVGSTSHRSSFPTLTSQAKKDAMQRAAMIAAMQQNGGAKILAAHRVGRRQDRPSRNIRFGEFHRICEIEYGFDQGKPLIANGRTLVHTTRVLRIDGQEKREDMLYLFSDVLVTGTKIRKRAPTSTLKSSTESGDGEYVANDDEASAPVDQEERGDSSHGTSAPVKETLLENPYAGHLENQHISRLTQVQADVVEDDERPLLKIAAPQLSSLLLFDSTTTRDSFFALLNETIVAHKHHLLFQSKYLADLKKFKRHSAFSFDTSFLKTWAIPGGLNLGSIKPTGGNSGSGSHGNGIIGPGTFTASPLASPGGGAFDPYQYQQYLNRPQSMAGSLFSFAMNGGSFPSFSDHHSKENSYATLRGANAANALQYHQQQQQVLQQQLQNRLSLASTISNRQGIERASSGSAFDALWFMKAGDHGKSIRKTAAEAVSAPQPPLHPLPSVSGSGGEDREKAGGEDADATGLVSATSSLHPSISGTNLYSLATNNVSNVSQNTNRHSSSSTFSILPSSSAGNHNMMGTLRNGAGWVPDEDATVCMVCISTKFGVLVRKHHCRLCGRVICWKCCQMKDVVLTDPTTPTTAVPHELSKPIRVCLDCIEHDASQEPNMHQQQHPSPPSASLPMQGVFGRLLSSTSTSPQLVTSATNATGSTFAMPPQNAPAHQMSFYPRLVSYGRSGRSYPHHHRASMYRIDVERVGEEDEDEEEGEEQNETLPSTSTTDENNDLHDNTTIASTTETTAQEQMHSREQSQSSSNNIIKSNHGTLRLKDLDPADINEEEVNSQIMTLESEVESLLIQGAPMMFGSGTNVSAGRSGGGSSAASKTRVMRGIPKEFLQAGGGLHGSNEGEEEVDEEDEGEEKTMEELLAEQDAQVKRILTR